VPAALSDPRPPPSFPENGSLDVSSLDDRQTLIVPARVSFRWTRHRSRWRDRAYRDL